MRNLTEAQKIEDRVANGVDLVLSHFNQEDNCKGEPILVMIEVESTCGKYCATEIVYVEDEPKGWKASKSWVEQQIENIQFTLEDNT